MGANAFFVTRAGEALPEFLSQCGYRADRCNDAASELTVVKRKLIHMYEMLAKACMHVFAYSYKQIVLNGRT